MSRARPLVGSGLSVWRRGQYSRRGRAEGKRRCSDYRSRRHAPQPPDLPLHLPGVHAKVAGLDSATPRPGMSEAHRSCRWAVPTSRPIKRRFILVRPSLRGRQLSLIVPCTPPPPKTPSCAPSRARTSAGDRRGKVNARGSLRPICAAAARALRMWTTSRALTRPGFTPGA